MEHEYLSIPEFAKRFKLHDVTVQRLCRDKELPARKVGGSWRIDVTEYEKGFSNEPAEVEA